MNIGVNPVNNFNLADHDVDRKNCDTKERDNQVEATGFEHDGQWSANAGGKTGST